MRLYHAFLLVALIGAPLTVLCGPVLADTPAQESSPSPAASPSDMQITARARTWYAMLQSGTIDRAQLDKQLNATLTDATVKQVAAQLQPLGDPKSFTLTDKMVSGQYTVYHYRVGLATTRLYFTFTLDPDGTIAGLFVSPDNS